MSIINRIRLLVQGKDRGTVAAINRPWSDLFRAHGLAEDGSDFTAFALQSGLESTDAAIATAQGAAADDATSKANAARDAAVATASADATNKADSARAAAISTASADATSKADNARAAAISAASADATNKANGARDDAIAAAATDAGNRVNTEATNRANADAAFRDLDAMQPAADGDLVTSALTRIFTGGVSRALRLDRLAGFVARAFGFHVVTDPKYGAVGDGVTDCYAALQAVATAVNAAGRGTVIYPPGTYYVGQYKITGGVSQNAITDIVFNGCVGLKVLGYGAKVDFKGDFYRAKDNGSGSYENSVCIIYRDCQRLTIEGVELDGNKDQMTKDPTVLEGANHGLYLQSCSYVDITNVHVHHWPTDGLYARENPFGASRIASKFVTVRNSRFEYNGRLGFGCVQLAHARLSVCSFSFNGNTGDSYGGHGPKSGVDVEPNLWTGSPGTPMDVDTGHILFENCRVEGNESAAYHFTLATKGVHDIAVRGGYIDTSANLTGDYSMVCDSINVLVQDVEIHTGATAQVWGTLTPGTGASSRFSRCRIYTTNTALATTGRGFNASIAGSCIVEDCDFIGQHTQPLGTYFPYIQAQSTTMRRCRIFIPAAAHDGTTGASHQASMLRCNAEDVEFTTTLVPTTTQHFSPLLDMTLYRYRDIKFLSGTAFRVSSNSTWDNNRPWNHRDRAVKRGVSADVGNTSKTLSATSDVEVQRWATPINAVKTCTLPAATNCYEGLRYMIVRESTATGAFNLNINLNSGTLLRALTAAGTFALVEWDSTLADFRQVGGGTF